MMGKVVVLGFPRCRSEEGPQRDYGRSVVTH